MAGQTGARTAVPADLTRPVSSAGRSARGPPGARRGGRAARITGLDAAAFGDRHWGREPLLARAAPTRDGFRDLLDLDGVDELLSRRGLRTPFIRLARNGTVVDSASFTGPGGVGAEIGDQVRDDRVAALFADGTTVVLQALHRTWPPVIDFTTRLAAELGPSRCRPTPTSRRRRRAGSPRTTTCTTCSCCSSPGASTGRCTRRCTPIPLRDQPWNDHAGAVAARVRDRPTGDRHRAGARRRDVPAAGLAARRHRARRGLGPPDRRRARRHPVRAGRGPDRAGRRAIPRCGRRCRWASTWPIPSALAPHLDASATALVDALGRVQRRGRRAPGPRPGVGRRPARNRSGRWPGRRSPRGWPSATSCAAGRGLRHRLRRRTATGSCSSCPTGRSRCPPATARRRCARCWAASRQPWVACPDMDEADQLVLVRRLLREGVLRRRPRIVTARVAPLLPFVADGRRRPPGGHRAAADRWFLVEHPGPWGRVPLTQSGIDPQAVAALSALGRGRARAGAAHPAARPVGAARGGGPRRWFRVDSRPGRESIRTGHFSARPASWPHAVRRAGRALRPARCTLVCAHGRHDTCCAVRGRPLAAALAAADPAAVWECSHIGGCRFAPALVLLPHGFVFGGVPAADGPALARGYGAGRARPALAARPHQPAARRAGRPAPRRASSTGAHGVDALRLVDGRRRPPASWRVELADPDCTVLLRERHVERRPAPDLRRDRTGLDAGVRPVAGAGGRCRLPLSNGPCATDLARRTLRGVPASGVPPADRAVRPRPGPRRGPWRRAGPARRRAPRSARCRPRRASARRPP